MDREYHRRCWGVALLACMVLNPEALLAQNAPAPAEAEPADETDLPRRPSPLVGDPKTPAELFEAAVLMAGIARADLAKMHLDKLAALDLDDTTLLALRDRFGAAPFLRLMNVKELRDTAGKLLERSNAAMLRRGSDPQYAVKLVEKFDSNDPEQQAAAASELRALGTLAVPGLMGLIGDPAGKHTESAMAALVQVGESAVPMLLGALQSSDPNVRANAMTVLGHLRSRQAAPFLWYPAFADSEPPGVRAAARMALARTFNVPEAGVDRIAGNGTTAQLTKVAMEHYRHEFPWPAAEGRVTLWTWSDQQRTVVPVQHAPEAASDLTGLALARQALALSPDSRKVQILYLSFALAADVRRAGFDKPLPTGPGTAHDLALSVGPTVVADVLAEALQANRPDAALAALKVLEQTGTRAQLAGSNGKRSPVVLALDYPDPRVQFAAAATILQFDPQGEFRASARVVDVLRRTAAASPRAHAVVGEVSASRAAQIGGFLRELGYEPIVLLSGREAFRAASERSDVDLVILHPNIIRWPLSETLANLRADSRTAGIPIVVHGPADLQPKLHVRLNAYRLISYATQAERTEDFGFQVQPFLAQIRNPPMDDAQRAALRLQAIEWLAHIAAGRRTKVFDITSAEGVLIDALADPRAARMALEPLGEIPSQSVQRRLAEVVLDKQADADLRKAAALRLAFHMQRFSLLLSQETVAQLHQLWSDEQQPAELRTALGSVIGSLMPDTTLVGKRLQAFPLAE